VPYREKLRVPVTWWVLAAVGTLAVFVAYDVALSASVAVMATAALALGCAAWLGSQGSRRVAVDADGLTAGRASLPAWAIGDVEALDPQATALARGVQADPQAYFVLAGYVATSVRVQVDDPGDPVPYWLVSTRDPDALAASLVAVRQSAAGGR
jgi:hypothetical protein